MDAHVGLTLPDPHGLVHTIECTCSDSSRNLGYECFNLNSWKHMRVTTAGCTFGIDALGWTRLDKELLDTNIWIRTLGP